MSGVHCQMSATIIDQSASDGSESHSIVTGCPRMISSAWFSGPSTWKIMKKMKPVTAGTTIIGSRKKTISEAASSEVLEEQQREREAESELDCGRRPP